MTKIKIIQGELFIMSQGDSANALPSTSTDQPTMSQGESEDELPSTPTDQPILNYEKALG